MNNIEFDWSKIKKGFSGFEDLAFSYVCDVFPNNNWEQTKRTRDGNKDAFTIICGFQPYQLNKEYWWMEAKYSTKSNYLTRYKLDATVVSAIINEEKISKIIFVTNIEIKSKTILDLKISLQKAIHCNEVHFVTNIDLLYWLTKNKKKALNFFDSKILRTIQLPDMAITSHLEIFEVNNSISIRESLRYIFVNQIYIACFSVFSNSDRKAKLSLDENFKLHTDSELLIHKGLNNISFCFELVKSGITQIIVRAKLDSLDIVSLYTLEVQNKTFFKLTSQDYMIQHILNEVNEFKENVHPQITLLEGLSGTGKTYMLSKLTTLLSSECVFNGQGSFGELDNINLIINIILFIIFPYIDPNTIDTNFLKKLTVSFNNEFIELVDIKQTNEIEQFQKLGTILGKKNYIFPKDFSINRRIIIIDDYHKFSKLVMNFFYHLFEIIKMKQIPVMFIIATQPIDSMLLEYASIHKCCINKQDISEIFNQIDLLKFTIPFQYFQQFSSFIEVFSFASYLKMINQKINSVTELRLASQSFANSFLFNEMVFSKFQDILTQHKDLKDILDNVYWSMNCKITNIYEFDFIKPLLRAELIQLTSSDEIIPFHDLYIEVYRKHFNRPNKLMEHEYLDMYYLTLKNQSNMHEVSKAVDKVKELVCQRKFKEVMYILSNMFNNEDKNILKARFREKNYYKLYTFFAIASTHTSSQKSGRVLFENLIEETKDQLDPDILEIYIENMWEALNSYYESIDFEKARETIKNIIRKMMFLKHLKANEPALLDNIRYHDVLVILSLIESEESITLDHTKFKERYERMIEKGFIYRAYTYKIRYAITLNSKDIETSIKFSKECLDYFTKNYEKTEKYFFWSSINYLYLTMIYHKKHENIILIHDLLKQEKQLYYNDYRKRIFAIAVYFLSINEIELAEDYLFDDSFVNRNLRNRQYAYFLLATGLYYAIKHEKLKAIQYHKDALSYLKLNSYRTLILHNIEVIEDDQFSSNKITFCTNLKEQLHEDYYYIDTRMIG